MPQYFLRQRTASSEGGVSEISHPSHSHGLPHHHSAPSDRQLRIDTNRVHEDDQRTWGRVRQKFAQKRLSTPKSVLQAHRTKYPPAVPSHFTNLHENAPLPFFEAVEGSEPRPELFPQFGSCPPLVLRKPQGVDAAASAAAESSPAVNVAQANGCSPAVASGSTSRPRCSSAPAETTPSPCGPLRVGVVFGGEQGPAPPVNVVAGIFKYLSAAAPGSRIFGFQDGPPGLMEGKMQEMIAHEVMASMNICGWHNFNHGTCSEGSCLPDDRVEDAKRAAAVCDRERLDSIVVIGGPRDLSWAAAIADNFAKLDGCRTTVVGVPHSKNLNLYVPRYLPMTLGFDSARRVLSEIAGNIFVDSLSSNKYWHFIRGGDDSLTLEVALQTRCNFSVLTMERRPKGDQDSEPPRPLETEEPLSTESLPSMSRIHSGDFERMSLKEAVESLKDVVERRRVIGRPSGVVLLSRYLIEKLPEMDVLKKELIQVLGNAEEMSRSKPPSRHEVGEKLLQSQDAKELFKRLPRLVQSSLIRERDSSGNPLLPTDLEAERILGRFVQQALKRRSSVSIAPRFHCMDLMSNAPLSSAFDCHYGYQLGHTAAALICERRTFYVACCADMHKPVEEWEPCAIPFSHLYPTPLTMSSLPGKKVWPPKAIPKVGWRLRRSLMEAHRFFREHWVECNVFKAVGPMQFGDRGEVGPMSDRSFTLLSEYISLNELKQMIQPVMRLPPPVVMNRDPLLVVRDIRVKENLSPLEQRRLCYTPRVPTFMKHHVRAQDEDICPQACDSNVDLSKSFPLTHAQVSAVRLVPTEEVHASELDAPSSPEGIRPQEPAPLRIGIAFASRQAPGFHNVVTGICDYLFNLSPPAEVIGFLGGHEGIITNNYIKITRDVVDQYRNLGGQDMLCQFSEPGSLAYKERLKAVTTTVTKERLDGLLLVGDLVCQVDTAFIAEACAAERLMTRVVGVPVSLDCNFPFVQQTIGFDTICRTISCYVGDLGNLAKTSGNHWVFSRILGDSWSHIAIECTLQAHPNLVLLSGSQMFGHCLPDITKSLCDVIISRYEAGHNHGVVLLPCGFAEDISEMRLLFTEILEIMNTGNYETGWDAIPNIAAKLKPSSAALFDIIPRDVQYEICFGGRERQLRGIDIMSISTDRLILRFVEIELQRRRRLGLLKEDFFNGVCYNMVYQARSSIPTDFDCDLAYTLGWGAGQLMCLGKSGLLIHASNLEKDVDDWLICGTPLTSFLVTEYDEEEREMKFLPANNQLLRKRGVTRPFSRLPLPEERSSISMGPVQFGGAIASHPSYRTTWHMQNMPLQDPSLLLQDISTLCGELQSTMALAKAESTLYAVNSLLSNAVSVLDSYKHLDESSKRSAESMAELLVGQKPQAWRTKTEAPPATQDPAAAKAAPPQNMMAKGKINFFRRQTSVF